MDHVTLKENALHKSPTNGLTFTFRYKNAATFGDYKDFSNLQNAASLYTNVTRNDMR